MNLIRTHGTTKSFKLKRELRKDFSSFGATNVTILGALITELLNFTLLLKKIRTDFSWRMKCL